MQQQHTSLGEHTGKLPDESRCQRRIRFHQGWWRAFVLAETAGPHPLRHGVHKDGASSFHIIAQFIEVLQMLALTWPGKMRAVRCRAAAVRPMACCALS